MRKCLTLAQVITIVAVVAVMLPGCGSETKQATEYMQQGDKLAKQYQEEAATWHQNFESAPSPATTKSPTSSVPAFEAFLEKIKALATEMSKTAGKAKAAYKKILSLNGVEDYAKYADLEIQVLDKSQEFITLSNTYVDKRSAMIISGDVASLPSMSGKYSENVSRLTGEINKLTGEAEKLKADKNL